jgi:hypothetical protein
VAGPTTTASGKVFGSCSTSRFQSLTSIAQAPSGGWFLVDSGNDIIRELAFSGVDSAPLVMHVWVTQCL